MRLEVWRARQVAVTDERFQGLCVTEAEVDDLLTRQVGLPTWVTASVDPEASVVRRRVDVLAADNRRRAELETSEGVRLRLHNLTERFGLTRRDLDVLLVALAPEIDLRYERLYAYLQDDVTRRRPSLDLVANLLCDSVQDKLAARQRLALGAPLRSRGLLALDEDPSHGGASLLTRSLRVEPRVVDYLLGSDEVAEAVAGSVHWSNMTEDLDGLPVAEENQQRLEWWLDADAGGGVGTGRVVHLQGPPGAGGRTLATALAQRLGLPLLCVDSRRLRAVAGAEFSEHVRAVLREAALYDAALCWEGFDGLLGDPAGEELRHLLAGIRKRSRPTFLSGTTSWEPSEAHRDLPFVRVELTTPDATARTQIWGQAMAESELAPDADLPGLAGAFRLGSGQIHDAAATAARLAHWRGGPDEPVQRLDLEEACRRHSDHSLAELAQHVRARRSWDDLVLPEEPLEQLRDLCARVRHRTRVHEGWGFRDKVGQGDGLTALFAGPPGTGKTMAAQVVARELGHELYTVDLSTVVSKYIGETEKNLSRVFDAAERSNALLFFDEADALFGKRSEVRDARDRFANIEVSYLLQRMEQHEGITILATNMRNNIDAAFLRRLAFVISFPFPNEQTRLRIWEGIWPDAVPMAPDIDLAELARGYEFSGGSIKNVALAAAFLAADEDAPVSMDHLARATRREQRNLGKVAIGGGSPPRRAPARDGNGERPRADGQQRAGAAGLASGQRR